MTTLLRLFLELPDMIESALRFWVTVAVWLAVGGALVTAALFVAGAVRMAVAR